MTFGAKVNYIARCLALDPKLPHAEVLLAAADELDVMPTGKASEQADQIMEELRLK